MEQSLTVHVPQTENVSYTLYAVGIKVDKPVLASDGSEIYIYIHSRDTGCFVLLLWENEESIRS